MNILHLRASNFYGGPERQLHLHARLARGTEFNIVIASFSEAGNSPEFLRIISDDGLQTHLFEVKSAYDRKAAGFIRDYIESNKIDILCTHDYRSHLLGYQAVKKTSTRWVAFSRGWTRDTLRVRIYTLLEKIFIRFARHIVAVSESQKRRLVDLGISAEKIAVAHNAVNISGIRAAVTVDLRKRFNFPPESIVVVSGGRFSREKGQRLLIEAASDMLKLNDNLRFILFGDGPDLNIIRNLVSQFRLEENIICPGFEKNLLGALRNADILANPSYSEGLPNIVLEGMALGVPVVATAVGGVPELITDGKSGILVPAGDRAALSTAILSLADDKNKRTELALAALDSLEKRFSFEKQMQVLSGVYRRVLKIEGIKK